MVGGMYVAVRRGGRMSSRGSRASQSEGTPAGGADTSEPIYGHTAWARPLFAKLAPRAMAIEPATPTHVRSASVDVTSNLAADPQAARRKTRRQKNHEHEKERKKQQKKNKKVREREQAAMARNDGECDLCVRVRCCG